MLMSFIRPRLTRKNLLMFAGAVAVTGGLYPLFGVLTALAFAVGFCVASVVAGIAPKGRWLPFGAALATVTLWYWLAGDITALVALTLGMALVPVLSAYTASLVGVMLIAHLLLPKLTGLLELPLLVAAAGMAVSVASAVLTRRVRVISASVYRGLAVTFVLASAVFWVLATRLPTLVTLGPTVPLRIFGSLMLGLVAAVLLAIIARWGAEGKLDKLGSLVRTVPVLFIGAMLYWAFRFAGLYGIALTALSMASFGVSIADRGYARVCAFLAALVLFAAYTQQLQVSASTPVVFQLADVRVLIGLLIGGVLPYLLNTRVMSAVLALAVPLAVGFGLGPEALGGVLVGATLTGLFAESDSGPVVRFAAAVAILISRFV